MAHLISAAEESYFTGAFVNFFETFSTYGPITVVKEPIKTLVSTNSAPMFGYGDTSNEANYTYTPVSGNFECIMDYPMQRDGGYMEDANQRIAHDEVWIQVQQPARDYIMNGKTELIYVDGKPFRLASEDQNEMFLSHTWYSFKLKLAP